MRGGNTKSGSMNGNRSFVGKDLFGTYIDLGPVEETS